MGFKVNFSQGDSRFGMTFESYSGSCTPLDNYDGDYVVTPKFTEQTIPTKDKVMVDDVTIKSIPISVVSNTSGGNTVIIGG